MSSSFTAAIPSSLSPKVTKRHPVLDFDELGTIFVFLER